MFLRTTTIALRLSRLPSPLKRSLVTSVQTKPILTMDPPASGPEDFYLPTYTKTLPVDLEEIGAFDFSSPDNYLAPWTFTPSTSESGANLLTAADALQTSLYPVAFPTETVYGLGANALSSAAVKGIYKAKQRPSDNPLIVHISSLEMLRRLLDPLGTHALNDADPIPEIYHPLIQKFWPGPLSILLPNPPGSRIAREVTANQHTFAARMPSNKLALALIQLSQLPLAAPSANASTKPSPTTAAHVAHDLAGRIEIILDGGSCSVGVESTVVDGLSSPPAILRPGGVGIQELRQIEGWEDVVVGYADAASENVSAEAPRAPGMKYKHYSPAARVVLADADVPWSQVWSRIQNDIGASADITNIGVIKTKHWPDFDAEDQKQERGVNDTSTQRGDQTSSIHTLQIDEKKVEVRRLVIGPSTALVARGLFSALRELDLCAVQVIYVEGIRDGVQSQTGAETNDVNGGEHHSQEDNRDNDGEDEGQVAAAVMNRLRKAAGERIVR